jgi:hypothetical protein
MMAMVVTIELPGGPTVRLEYDPARAAPQAEGGLRRVADPWTRIALTDQGSAAVDLKDVIMSASAYLFAFCLDSEYWPADLRPARQDIPEAQGR